MPDYDPKSIPILDDIIEDDMADTDKTDAAGIDSAKTVENESIPDLFATAAADITASDIEIETAEPEIGSIDKFIPDTDDSAAEAEATTVESALIDYHSEAVIEADDDIPASEDIDKTLQASSQAPGREISVESIVDDVVKQLIPDLEQQLRLLVKQALEEKLPSEIIKQVAEEKND